MSSVRAPCELRASSVRAPCELRRSSMRAPKELRKSSEGAPQELRRSSVFSMKVTQELRRSSVGAPQELRRSSAGAPEELRRSSVFSTKVTPGTQNFGFLTPILGHNRGKKPENWGSRAVPRGKKGTWGTVDLIFGRFMALKRVFEAPLSPETGCRCPKLPEIGPIFDPKSGAK